jgi:hypothetical protein
MIQIVEPTGSAELDHVRMSMHASWRGIVPAACVALPDLRLLTLRCADHALGPGGIRLRPS